jgi:hypothetical protein
MKKPYNMVMEVFLAGVNFGFFPARTIANSGDQVEKFINQALAPFGKTLADFDQKKPLTDEELLKANGWEVECQSPFEIRTADGSFASGEAAKLVLQFLRSEE